GAHGDARPAKEEGNRPPAADHVIGQGPGSNEWPNPELDELAVAELFQEAMATIEKITSKVVAGEDDPRLRWGTGRKRVRVLVERAFPDRRVRGPSLHIALENRLKAAGWIWAPGTVLHTYERCLGRPDVAVGQDDRES